MKIGIYFGMMKLIWNPHPIKAINEEITLHIGGAGGTGGAFGGIQQRQDAGCA